MSVFKDKDSGKWSVSTSYCDWKGKNQTKYKRGFDTKREAQEWKREFLLRYANDLNMPFNQFVMVYEEDRRPRLKLNTWLSKEYIIKDKLLPYFGSMPMNEISSRDIIKWQNALIDAKGKDGKPYSQTYLKTIHNQLTAILTHAVRFYGLKSNPATKAGSMGKKNAEEMNFYTREEYAAFAKVAMHEPLAYYAFEVLYWTGIRIGELLALTLADIDFKKKTIRINKSYQRLKGMDVVTEPKTAKSKRTIAIPDVLCYELRQYVATQYEILPEDRLFPVSKSFLSNHIRDNAEKAGLKKIRIHDLRHSHVSHLIELGFSALAIADRLGHESVEITYRYAHLFPQKQEEMANRLNEEMEVVNGVQKGNRAKQGEVSNCRIQVLRFGAA